MQQTSLAARAAELRSELNYHNLRYYQMDDPVISDGQYDALLRELQEIEREHPELQAVDSPTLRVGGDPSPSFLRGPALQAHAQPGQRIRLRRAGGLASQGNGACLTARPSTWFAN